LKTKERDEKESGAVQNGNAAPAAPHDDTVECTTCGAEVVRVPGKYDKPDDTALLRQALEALQLQSCARQIVPDSTLQIGQGCIDRCDAAITALRARLDGAPQPARELSDDERSVLNKSLRKSVKVVARSQPARELPPLPESTIRNLWRDIKAAENPQGMSAHDGKIRVDASIVRRLLTPYGADA
jgi:hypothetical protein